MRASSLLAGLLGLALVAVPVGAAIKALTLAEHVELTSDTVEVTILGKDTLVRSWPVEDAVWTQLHVQGTSMRTGASVETDVYFLGSHEPADGFGTSEMPMLQDTRVGAKAVLFLWDEPGFPGGPVKTASNLGDVYRVETAFGQPVVIGKGEGFAFSENVTVVEARERVRQAHVAAEAKKAGK